MTMSNPTRTERTSRLENGDHLSACEFMERYEAMPGLKKAELIDGVVYVPSPTRWSLHAVPHQAISTWLGFFWRTPQGLRPAITEPSSSTSRMFPNPTSL